MLAAPGHAYNLLSAPGDFSTGETGEYSTGVDNCAQSPDLRFAPLMDMDFAVSCPLVRHWRLISGSCPSTRTFAIRFFRTPPRGDSPCVLTGPSPPSGWAGDLHPQTAEHAQHTTMAPRAPAWRSTRRRSTGRSSPTPIIGALRSGWKLQNAPGASLSSAVVGRVFHMRIAVPAYVLTPRKVNSAKAHFRGTCHGPVPTGFVNATPLIVRYLHMSGLWCG